MGRSSTPELKIDNNYIRIQESAKDITFRGDYVGSNLIYGGFAKAGSSTADPVWKIIRLTYDVNDNLLRLEYPERTNDLGSSDYEFVYDDRATYNYS